MTGDGTLPELYVLQQEQWRQQSGCEIEHCLGAA